MYWIHKQSQLHISKDDKIELDESLNLIETGWPKYEVKKYVDGDRVTYQLVSCVFNNFPNTSRSDSMLKRRQSERSIETRYSLSRLHFGINLNKYDRMTFQELAQNGINFYYHARFLLKLSRCINSLIFSTAFRSLGDKPTGADGCWSLHMHDTLQGKYTHISFQRRRDDRTRYRAISLNISHIFTH